MLVLILDKQKNKIKSAMIEDGMIKPIILEIIHFVSSLLFLQSIKYLNAAA